MASVMSELVGYTFLKPELLNDPEVVVVDAGSFLIRVLFESFGSTVLLTKLLGESFDVMTGSPG